MAETVGIEPDDLFKDDINIHVVFVDLRQNPPPHWDDFTVKFDATKSSSTLAVVILEEYDDYRGQLKEFLDLSDRNFRQCLFFADDALVGKKSMMSLKTLGISDGATVEMRLFGIDDPRFAKLWEDALEEEKKMMRELVILIPQETETTRLTFCFDQQTSGEDMFFFIKEAVGMDKEDYELTWAGTASKVEAFDSVWVYFPDQSQLKMTIKMAGGAKINVQKSLKKKVAPKEVDVNVFDLVKKVKEWKAVSYDGFMKSLSADELNTLFSTFTTGKAHLDVRFKKMAEVAGEIKQFNDAIRILDDAREHIRELVFQSFVEHFADEKGEVDTTTIKKSIEFYITLKKQQESVGDVKMDG